MAWTSPDLLARFYRYLGRGNGGTFGPDELWTESRAYETLSDAYEQVVTDCAPVAPAAFMGAPVQLVTADGGVTFTWPDGAYPLGHAEVYARLSGNRELYASTYSSGNRDEFVIEGATIRTPGNRVHAYAAGPYGRAVFMPARLDASTNPTLAPDGARELILWRALAMAAEVANGELDPAPWERKYTEARDRWFRVWATQYATVGNPALPGTVYWWRSVDWQGDG